MKDCKPSVWWSEVKKLSGLSSASPSKRTLANLSQHLEGTPEGEDLAKSINEAFLSRLSIFEPLPKDYEPQQYDITTAPYVVSTDSVFLKLSSLNPKKATGPDGVPSWLIKENADLLVGPVSDIIKSSFREGRFPRRE